MSTNEPGGGWGQQPGYQQPGQYPGGGYQQYPASPYAYQGAPQQQSKVLSILAIVFGCVALLILPPLFGIAGIILGIIAKAKDQPYSTAAIIVPIVGLIGGIAIGVAVSQAYM